jgi:hypothetical protein
MTDPDPESYTKHGGWPDNMYYWLEWEKLRDAVREEQKVYDYIPKVGD